MNFQQFWSTSDTFSHVIAILMLLMSMTSWYWILRKGWHGFQLRRQFNSSNNTLLDKFWAQPNLIAGAETLREKDTEQVFVSLVESTNQVISHFQEPQQNTMSDRMDLSEMLIRTLRQQISFVALRLESGLTILASIGSTAPFVGLLGTVWGIFHALTAISGSGQMSIDKIAGPVGEALIMTAFGLFVAIPAVLAYNTFTRINRIVLAEVDGFAHDLHSFAVMGTQKGNGNTNDSHNNSHNNSKSIKESK